MTAPPEIPGRGPAEIVAVSPVPATAEPYDGHHRVRTDAPGRPDPLSRAAPDHGLAGPSLASGRPPDGMAPAPGASAEPQQASPAAASVLRQGFAPEEGLAPFASAETRQPDPTRDPAFAVPLRAAPRAPSAQADQHGETTQKMPVDMGGTSRIAPLSDTPPGAAPVAEPGAVDRGLTEPRGGTLPSTTTAVHADAGRPGPGSPQHAALQVADAVRQAGPTGALEIALDPEELGRVRLVFSAAEAGLAVTLQAERGETLEMLRRHVDLLLSDLRARGFDDVQVDFGGSMWGGQREASKERGIARHEDAGVSPAATAATAAAHADVPAPTGGLDLRL